MKFKTPDCDSKPGENDPMKILQMIGIITFGFLVIYVGSYLMLVKPGAPFIDVSVGAKPVTVVFPKFEWGSPILSKLHLGLGFYEPIHIIDCRLFPSRWYEQLTIPPFRTNVLIPIYTIPIYTNSLPPASSPLISTNKSP